jgi:hypothetical protein
MPKVAKPCVQQGCCPSTRRRVEVQLAICWKLRESGGTQSCDTLFVG